MEDIHCQRKVLDLSVGLGGTMKWVIDRIGDFHRQRHS